jgi:hypothetical protein
VSAAATPETAEAEDDDENDDEPNAVVVTEETTVAHVLNLQYLMEPVRVHTILRDFTRSVTGNGPDKVDRQRRKTKGSPCGGPCID